jgi:glycosyltransferase involved in cell wall biosynthesis
MPFINESKIVLIRNGIEKINFIDRSIVRRALIERVPYSGLPLPDVNGKEIWIGTISELSKNKGHKYILEALSKIKVPFLFFIIGEGIERKNIEKLIVERNLQKKVYLLGFIDTVANLYLKAFDIFAFTSLKEGLPYALLEAGLAGNAIVSTDIGGIPDIINDGKNGLLNRAKDVEEIQKDIEYLISHKEVRKEFGKKIKEKVEREFTVEKMLKKTFALYR